MREHLASFLFYENTLRKIRGQWKLKIFLHDNSILVYTLFGHFSLIRDETSPLKIVFCLRLIDFGLYHRPLCCVYCRTLPLVFPSYPLLRFVFFSLFLCSPSSVWSAPLSWPPLLILLCPLGCLEHLSLRGYEFSGPVCKAYKKIYRDIFVLFCSRPPFPLYSTMLCTTWIVLFLPTSFSLTLWQSLQSKFLLFPQPATVPSSMKKKIGTNWGFALW